MIKAKNLFTTSNTAFAVDRKGKIVVWNKAAVKTFGFAESDALGQFCWKLLSGQDMFGNPLCCKGCPIRASAFSKGPVNQFQINFGTASNQRRQFTISTLLLSNRPSEDILVHLCQPETVIAKNSIAPPSEGSFPPNYQRNKLTRREMEVLTHLHKGKSIANIADTLKISPLTVRNHVQHVLLKLNVHSRYEAVAIGRKLNLI